MGVHGIVGPGGAYVTFPSAGYGHRLRAFLRRRILSCSSLRRLPSHSSRVISEVLLLMPLVTA